MTEQDLKILEDYCRVSQEHARLERERNRLRGLIDQMGLKIGFSIPMLGGTFFVKNGNRKLLILDGTELVKELGNRFFADNVTLPIGKLEATFKEGIVQKLAREKLVRIDHTKPFVCFQSGGGLA